MQELSLTYDQFQDLGILAGFQDSPSIPLPEWSFKAVLDLIQRYRNGPAAISAAYNEFPHLQQSGYTDTFARSKTMIKFSLILHADDGRVMPLPLALPPPANVPAITAADVPNDIQEVFSYRLPDEVYFQLFRGLISPRLLGALTSGYWIEHPPLCGGESDEYRRFLKNIITEHPASPRCTALALLATPLNAFWRTRQVYASYYFDPNNAHPIPHNAQGAVKSLERMVFWNVPGPVIEEELRRQKVRLQTKLSFYAVLLYLAVSTDLTCYSVLFSLLLSISGCVLAPYLMALIMQRGPKYSRTQIACSTRRMKLSRTHYGASWN